LEVELAVRRAETYGLKAPIGGVQARFRVLEPMLRDVLSGILPEAPERGRSDV
jgi:hypothetical protein